MADTEVLEVPQNALQPVYPVKIVNSAGSTVDLTGATIY